MPGIDGLAATRQPITDTHGEAIRVVMLTTFDLDEYVYEALRAGASGFLVKDIGDDQLTAGIRAAARGETLLAPSVTRRLSRPTPAAHRPANHCLPVRTS